MTQPERRGCGYKKLHALYFTCSGRGFACDQLPLPLHTCPTCGGGFKQSLGVTWFTPKTLFLNCPHHCPIIDCPSRSDTKHILMHVGKSFYKTPKDFINEANRMGVSKRISAVPKDFVLGKTWIFLAHPEAINNTSLGIFYIFKPDKIEYTVTEEEYRDTANMDKLRKRGLTPTPLPDIPEHHGTVYKDIKKPKSSTVPLSSFNNINEV